MTTSLAGLVPGIIDTHIHQWDPFTTPRGASRLAPLYRRAPGLVDALLPVLASKAKRDLVLTPEHVGRPFLPANYTADAAGVPDAVGVPIEAVLHVEADWQGDPIGETSWLETLPFGLHGAPLLAGIVAGRHGDRRHRRDRERHTPDDRFHDVAAPAHGGGARCIRAARFAPRRVSGFAGTRSDRRLRHQSGTNARRTGFVVRHGLA